MINVEDHLGLARKVAYQFCRSSKTKYTYDEVESTAFLGLIEAANNFDESKGFKFSTYAIPVITGRIKRMYRDDKWYNIKRGVPHEIISLNSKISDTENVQIIDSLEDKENIEESIVNHLIVSKLLELLTERDKKIIYLYFYEQLSQSQISKIMNLSQVSVSRIIRASLNKMREELAA